MCVVEKHVSFEFGLHEPGVAAELCIVKFGTPAKLRVTKFGVIVKFYSFKPCKLTKYSFIE